MSKPAPSSKWSSHPTSLWHGYVTLLVTTAAGTSFGLLLCNILLLCSELPPTRTRLGTAWLTVMFASSGSLQVHGPANLSVKDELF